MMRIILIMWGMNISAAHAAPRLDAMRVEDDGDAVMLILQSKNLLLSRQVFLLDDPPRMVVDIARVDSSYPAYPVLKSHMLLRGVRIAPYGRDASRIVLDLKHPLTDYVTTSRRTDNGLYELVMTMRYNRDSSDSASMSTEYYAPARQVASANARPVIMIDAGHGGKDPGAIGASRVLEKDITLTYARALQKILQQTGRYDAILSRDTDAFIYLHERVKLARQRNADMFISIHADTAQESEARGVSVYTVSEEASHKEAAILASQANAADKIGGIDFMENNPEVADILLELAARESRVKSNKLADLLVHEFRSNNMPVLNNPVRHAGFRVLKAPDVPSVLIEIGFLSNPHDEILLQQTGHRSKAVRAIAKAVEHYFSAM